MKKKNFQSYWIFGTKNILLDFMLDQIIIFSFSRQCQQITNPLYHHLWVSLFHLYEASFMCNFEMYFNFNLSRQLLNDIWLSTRVEKVLLYFCSIWVQPSRLWKIKSLFTGWKGGVGSEPTLRSRLVLFLLVILRSSFPKVPQLCPCLKFKVLLFLWQLYWEMDSNNL